VAHAVCNSTREAGLSEVADFIACTNVGANTYLAPSDSLTSDHARAALRGAVDSCLSANRVQLVLNLERVQLLDGKALETILDAHAQLAQRGGSLRLVNFSPLVKDICIATGLLDAESAAARGSNVMHTIGEHRPRGHRRKLGEHAVEMGLLTWQQLTEALELQKQSGRLLGQVLLEHKFLPESALFKAMSRQMGIPLVALRAGLYDAAAIGMVPRDTARRLHVLPMFKVHDTLTLATSDPEAIPALDEIQEITGCKLRLVLTRSEEISRNLAEAYSGSELSFDLVENQPADLELVQQIETDQNTIDEMAEASPVINLVNGLIQRAVRDRASDIHIECARTKSTVRFRIDGVLYEILTLRPDLHAAAVSRLKVMAKLDIAERRMPQDGRLQVVTHGRGVDLRFSSLPGIYGEKVVLRVLDKNQSILDIEKLGMRAPSLALLKKLLGRSYGLILVTGPTGSGKTTTLYAATNYLKSTTKNIVTIEDPVEYQLDIINQNQVNDSIGLGFAKMLKHILRQDPDIIMVGEIRDRETAEIAVQAALTGHLVLSTLHTNDAVGAVSRLIDMGVPAYLLSSALAGVVAQRLVRQVCQTCKTTYLPLPELATKHGWSPTVRLVKGRGCPACFDSGYRGRLGIYEILESSDELQRLMIKSPTKEELEAFVRGSGHQTLFADGLARAVEGGTTLEEISRVIHAVQE
jgi:type IV pilus assembly protein PilB